MTRRRPDDRPCPIAAHHRRSVEDGSGLETNARVADALARAFGVLVVLVALATAFGGWIATLQ